MPNSRSRVDAARVLSDFNALRGIGAYKTGVHEPTFSEPPWRGRKTHHRVAILKQ
jgi:N-carbamoyl-L-amino-acid hydrolase